MTNGASEPASSLSHGEAREEHVSVVSRVGEPVLSARVRRLLGGSAGVRLVTDTDDEPADVAVTDSLSGIDRDLPAVVLCDGAAQTAALAAGAAGVLPRGAQRRELLAAIVAASAGLVALPRELAEEAFEAHVPDDMPTPETGSTDDASGVSRPAVTLTPRESEVLQLLTEGAANKVIARRLGISMHTAKFHVASLQAKLGARSRTDTVVQAVRLGLVML
jgi:DNA-binding NarL/FixJ family response regulator